MAEGGGCEESKERGETTCRFTLGRLLIVILLRLLLLQSHLAVPDGKNPRNLSGTANYPGQRVKIWCKTI